jgi:hypothetical protein
MASLNGIKGHVPTKVMFRSGFPVSGVYPHCCDCASFFSFGSSFVLETDFETMFGGIQAWR